MLRTFPGVVRRFWLPLSLCGVVALGACARPEGDTPSQQRAHINQANTDILNAIYGEYPQARDLVNGSVGYATFTNIETKLSIVGGGNGYGVATDRRSGKKIYMTMRKLHVGFGAGVQEFDLLLVFKTRDNFDEFIESGWQFGAGADASVKERDGEGGDIGMQAALDPSMDPAVFQVTEAGIMVGATAEGFKFSKDDELN